MYDLISAIVWFYTLTNLQGSQTKRRSLCFTKMFYTLTNLQGSQTGILEALGFEEFYTLTNLQGSQTDTYTPRTP